MKGEIKKGERERERWRKNIFNTSYLKKFVPILIYIKLFVLYTRIRYTNVYIHITIRTGATILAKTLSRVRILRTKKQCGIKNKINAYNFSNRYIYYYNLPLHLF